MWPPRKQEGQNLRPILTLGAQVGLHSLSVRARGVVDVLSSAIRSDERDGLDPRLLAEVLDGGDRAVEDRKDTLRQTCFRESQLKRGMKEWKSRTSLHGELGDDHRCSRVTLRGFDDQTVAGRDGVDRPKRDHSREVEPVMDRVSAGERAKSDRRTNGQMAAPTPSGTRRVKVSMSLLTSSFSPMRREGMAQAASTTYRPSKRSVFPRFPTPHDLVVQRSPADHEGRLPWRQRKSCPARVRSTERCHRGAPSEAPAACAMRSA